VRLGGKISDSIFKIWDYTGSSDFGVLRHAISSFQTAKARQADIMSAALFSPFASELTRSPICIVVVSLSV
jgi:hypothetical protein